MAILRGLSSQLLSCGCLAGVYETYEGEVVTILDARGTSCTVSTHRDGNAIPQEAIDEAYRRTGQTAQRDLPARARR